MEIIKNTEDRGDSAVLFLSGEVDMASSPKLRQALMALTKVKKPTIVIDLEGVEYIDSSGLATLIECMKTAKGYSGKMVLSRARSKVCDVFKLARLTSFFEFTDELPES